MKTIGLLGGVSWESSAEYYRLLNEMTRDRLEKNWNLTVLIPGENDRETVDRVIFDELCQGKVVDSSRDQYLEIMNRLSLRGAEAIILGCTEIPMLVRQEHTSLPVFDSLDLHVIEAVDRAL